MDSRIWKIWRGDSCNFPLYQNAFEMAILLIGQSRRPNVHGLREAGFVEVKGGAEALTRGHSGDGDRALAAAI